MVIFLDLFTPILVLAINSFPIAPDFINDAIPYVAMMEVWIPMGFLFGLLSAYTVIYIGFAVIKWVLKIVPFVG